MEHQVKSVVFTAPDVVECQVESRELAIDEAGVLLQTRYSCISAGTELAKLTGLQPVQFPFCPGNRAVARVLEVGPKNEHFQPGDLAFSYTPHTSHSPGIALVAPLPDSLDVPAASLLGMAMVALSGVQTARPELGDKAVVTGAGLVGQLAAQLLHLAGADPIVIDPIAGRLQTARQCGIAHTVNAAEQDAAAVVAELTDGRGADIVLECTGVPQVAAGTPAFCRRSATVVFVGSPRGALETDITPLLNAVHVWGAHGDLTLKGAHEWKLPLRSGEFNKHSHDRNLRMLARLMESKQLKLEPLLSKIYLPEACADAFADLQTRKDDVLGAVFDWTAGG